MGWTSYYVGTEMTAKERQRELDDMNNMGDFKVLKSAMRGSTYYAAIERTNGEKRMVFAVVTLTSCRDGEFAYKDMDESEHPYYYDCPKGILDLLTPTDCKSANKWRENCRKRIEERKNGTPLSKLPVGSVIEFDTAGGLTIKLIKREPAYQFKTYWFQNFNSNTYYQKKYIPKDFRIVSLGNQ